MKFFAIFLTVTAALMLTAVPSSAFLTPKTMEAAGTLEAVETVKEGEISVDYVTIGVNGENFSTIFAPNCRFYDERGQQIKKSDFIRRYLRRYVLMNLQNIPNGSMVVSCQAK